MPGALRRLGLQWILLLELPRRVACAVSECRFRLCDPTICDWRVWTSRTVGRLSWNTDTELDFDQDPKNLLGHHLRL